MIIFKSPIYLIEMTNYIGDNCRLCKRGILEGTKYTTFNCDHKYHNNCLAKYYKRKEQRCVECTLNYKEEEWKYCYIKDCKLKLYSKSHIYFFHPQEPFLRVGITSIQIYTGTVNSNYYNFVTKDQKTGKLIPLRYFL